MIGTRCRLTSAGQQERDWYERLEHEERKRGDGRMNIADRFVVIRRDHGQVFVYDGPPGPGKLVESRCPDGSATDPWGNEAPTGDWRKDGLELPGGVRLGPIGFAYCVFCGTLTAEGNPDGHNCPAGLLRRVKRFCQLARICGPARRPRPHDAGFDIEDAIEQLMRDLDDPRGSDSPE